MNKRKNMFYIISRFVLFIVLKLFFFFKVTGREFIPKSGGCIIASNHLSYLDPVVLSVASTRILNFMAKEDLFRGNWFFKKLITVLNAFPIQRGKNDLKAIRLAIDKLKAGDALIIFPEGTRSATGDLKQGESGVSMLAAKAGVPVIPVLIVGTERAMPIKSKNFFLFTPIQVHFAAPLEFKAGPQGAKVKDAYQKFSDELIESIKQIKLKIACK